MKEEITVTLKTITPLWTGDAWQKCTEIRPSSLIGSLRFWFEVICYFSGICKKEDFNSKNGRFEKEVNKEKFKECLSAEGNFFESKIKCLLKQGIPLPSIIFGTTNWKSLIEIKIEKDPFYEENLKIEPHGKIVDGKNWYFGSPSYQGEFSVIFKVEEKILGSIFYPLLTFMDKYGFWGGKWNIGYGRLKVLEVKIDSGTINKWKKNDFKLIDFSFSWKDKIETKELDFSSGTSEFLKGILSKLNDDTFSFSCEEEEDFRNKMKSFPKKFIVLKGSQGNGNDYESIIRSLLKTKVKIRNCLRHKCEKQFKNCFEKRNGKEIFNGEKNLECNGRQIECKELKLWKTFRHKLLGEQGEGSKILPYIYEEQGQLKGGFLSIAGLLNLEGEDDE